jgi:mono/diheme cytochrome c family protein
MYSNGVRRSDVAKYNLSGFTEASPWSHSEMDRGELMFRGQCMNCHTLDGYRSMRRLMHGRDWKSITNIVTMLHEAPATSPYKHYMPPLVGTKEEVEDLIAYLDRMENPVPAGALAGR